MTLKFRFAAIVVLYSVLYWTTGASADPIRVTTGTVEVTRLGFPGVAPTSIDLSGDRGFSVQAIAGFGLFGPGIDCFDGCVSGETADPRASWTGSDVQGTATLDGIAYSLGAANADAHVTVGFFSNTEVVIPELAEPSLALTVPFIFNGVFTHGLTGGNWVVEPLEGSGRVTMFLERAFVSTVEAERYVLVRTVYEFEETAPVPEPGTLVLVGTVGAMALARRMRRSASLDSGPSTANGRR